jgi:hypothetical protein
MGTISMFNERTAALTLVGPTGGSPQRLGPPAQNHGVLSQKRKADHRKRPWPLGLWTGPMSTGPVTVSELPTLLNRASL